VTDAGGSLVYEVELAVDPEVAEEFAFWLAGHIRDVLECEGFVRAEWLDVDAGVGEPVRWRVRYTLHDREALDAYLAGPSGALRADGEGRFGGRFQATRRVMTVREVMG
jgi:hypothetical protein